MSATSRSPQMLWRQVRGQVLAQRGDLEEGERLAREAVALTPAAVRGTTRYVNQQAALLWGRAVGTAICCPD